MIGIFCDSYAHAINWVNDNSPFVGVQYYSTCSIKLYQSGVEIVLIYPEYNQYLTITFDMIIYHSGDKYKYLELKALRVRRNN